MARTHFRVLRIYSWGWDFSLPRGYLTYSSDGYLRHLYYSPDATPGHPKARELWRRVKRTANTD